MNRKCTETCTYYKDQDGDVSCFHHGNVLTNYRAGDALDMADMGRHVRYTLSEGHVLGLYNHYPRFTMEEMARELGCSIDVLERQHRKMGLAVIGREDNTRTRMRLVR